MNKISMILYAIFVPIYIWLLSFSIVLTNELTNHAVFSDDFMWFCEFFFLLPFILFIDFLIWIKCFDCTRYIFY